ncbi:unnamed protein product [Prunus armeniaca]|uniref:Uncharacterized protein n=1 Tax=Prunus armeniaca TaxID=36596 RepID=A0A6J5UWG7_PRUAR|nr:unnamed protein product [Prunus armeniaca]
MFAYYFIVTSPNERRYFLSSSNGLRPSTKEHEIEEVEGTWYRSCLDKWMRWSLEICRRAPSLAAPCSERRHLGVFIVAWLEQHVRCVVIEKGILHVSQALFRPRDEGPLGCLRCFTVNNKMVRTTWIFATFPTDGAKSYTRLRAFTDGKGEKSRGKERELPSALFSWFNVFLFGPPSAKGESPFCGRTTTDFYPWACQRGSPLEAHPSEGIKLNQSIINHCDQPLEFGHNNIHSNIPKTISIETSSSRVEEL